MKDIIIVGAGGFGRDVLYLIKDINKNEKQWNVKGFIDDNTNALDGVKCDYKIIGTIKDWQPSSNEVFAIGIASPKVKEIVVNIMKGKGAKFETIINPKSFISEYVDIGEGCIITALNISDNVTIGDFVHMSSAIIGQDSVIGDYSTITAFVNIASATIGKRVFIGSHSVVLNNKKVGDDAIIAVGSIVVNHVKSGAKVIGYPAKRMDF